MRGSPYDIVVIGAGVIGCALARELSRFDLKCLVLEANADFGDESSKGNSALLCSGYDTPRGSLERRLVRRGHARYLAEAPDLGLPILQIGAVSLAWTEAEAETLHTEVLAAKEDGFARVALMGPDEIYRRWPTFARGALAALWAPEEAIVDPFSTPYAYLLDAVTNGVEYRWSCPVIAAARDGAGWRLTTKDGDVWADIVLNCGGLRADLVDALAGYGEIEVRPRRGQYILFDKSARPLLDVITTPVATAQSRGILITPTVFGNILVGPTAEEVDDRDDRRVTKAGLAQLLQAADRILPGLREHSVTTCFAGMRPATDRSEYRIIPRIGDRWITVAGIRSTGLSAALGIAEYVAGILVKELRPTGRSQDRIQVSVPSLCEADLRPCLDGARISTDPAYGEIVCHCERVSLGEVRDALHSRLPPQSLKGLKRRTRVMFGRCQAFFCGARVQALFDGARSIDARN